MCEVVGYMCGVYLYICEYVCRGQRLMPGVFLNLLPLYFLGKGSHLNPEFTEVSSLYPPGMPCLCPLCTEITDGLAAMPAKRDLRI